MNSEVGGSPSDRGEGERKRQLRKHFPKKIENLSVMVFPNNNPAATQRDQALSILEKHLAILSKLYKECYLSKGRGALLVYAANLIEKGLPAQHEYRTKEESFDIFDDLGSRSQLENMIDNYDPKKEGILMLITSYSNAAYFVTVKFA